MKVLLAFDKYKGSLSAAEVSAVVREGFQVVFPEAEFQTLPIADGGEGFVTSLVDKMGGELLTTTVEDALGRKVEAEWGLIPWGEGKKAGVIEMSAASGLWRISEEERDIMKASTYGTGELISAAATTEGVEHLYVGLGGSATNDMGCGMAEALGVQFIGTAERLCPESLSKVTEISLENRCPLPSITVACDVDNPLCGENGASAVFGPQKGATPELVEELDALLNHLSTLTATPELMETPGAGAAGGLGFGMMAFTDAELVSGFDLVAEALRLEEAISGADLVLTGEGGLDAQSLGGKGPIGVAKLARKHGKPCLAVVGKVEREVDWSPYFQQVSALIETGIPLEELIAETSQHLRELSEKLAREISL